jgi:hypothetical protein
MDMFQMQMQTAMDMHQQAVNAHLAMMRRKRQGMTRPSKPRVVHVRPSTPTVSREAAKDFLVRLMRTGIERDYYERIEVLGLLDELRETYALCKQATYLSTQIDLCQRFMERSLKAAEAYKRNHR